jgi:hypothetical protein
MYEGAASRPSPPLARSLRADRGLPRSSTRCSSGLTPSWSRRAAVSPQIRPLDSLRETVEPASGGAGSAPGFGKSTSAGTVAGREYAWEYSSPTAAIRAAPRFSGPCKPQRLPFAAVACRSLARTFNRPPPAASVLTPAADAPSRSAVIVRRSCQGNRTSSTHRAERTQPIPALQWSEIEARYDRQVRAD